MFPIILKGIDLRVGIYQVDNRFLGSAVTNESVNCYGVLE